MFNDRDLGVLGAGALLSVLCLLLPLPFVGKVAFGLGVLVGFMVVAFLRLGPDRIPLEEWLRRRVRFHLQARRYTYQQEGTARRRRRLDWADRLLRRQRAAGEERSQPVPTAVRPAPKTPGGLWPIAFVLDDVRVYPLATLLLAVVGIYFLVWLAEGGAQEIAWLMGGVLR